MNDDTLADVEGDAALVYERAGADMHDPPSIVGLCVRLTGHPPRFRRQCAEACLEDGKVWLRQGLWLPRARWLTGHELSERYYAETGYDGADIEERCDALGAALVAPRPTFLRAMRTLGHRVHALADAFATTQSLALLRIGEVSGRPVMLLRSPEPLVRGEPYGWPSTSALVRTLRERPAGVHPLRITDEPGKWGLMAEI